MKRFAKALLLAGLAFSALGVVHAATQTYVQIRPTGSLQPGTTNGFHTSSGTVDTFTASTTTVTKETVGTLTPSNITGTVADSSTQTHTGSQTFTGALTGATGTITNFTATSATMTTVNLTNVTGTVADSSTQTHTGAQTFSGVVTLGTVGGTITDNSTSTHTGTQTFGTTVLPTVSAATSGYYLVAQGPGVVPKYQATGLVIQISSFTTQASSATTAATFVNTNVTLAITPTYASSYIRVTVTASFNDSTSGVGTWFNLTRNGTNLGNTNGTSGFVAYQSVATTGDQAFTFVAIDNPNTTSAVTYTLQFRTGGGTLTLDAIKNSIIAEEIAR